MTDTASATDTPKGLFGRLEELLEDTTLLLTVAKVQEGDEELLSVTLVPKPADPKTPNELLKPLNVVGTAAELDDPNEGILAALKLHGEHRKSMKQALAELDQANKAEVAAKKAETDAKRKSASKAKQGAAQAKVAAQPKPQPPTLFDAAAQPADNDAEGESESGEEAPA